MWVGIDNTPICIPANSVKVVQGKTNKITKRLTCMVEGRDIHNLPMGVIVNRAMVTPKHSKKVPVVLANTNSYNIWIRQPLLAADVSRWNLVHGTTKPSCPVMTRRLKRPSVEYLLQRYRRMSLLIM